MTTTTDQATAPSPAEGLASEMWAAVTAAAPDGLFLPAWGDLPGYLDAVELRQGPGARVIMLALATWLLAEPGNSPRARLISQALRLEGERDEALRLLDLAEAEARKLRRAAGTVPLASLDDRELAALHARTRQLADDARDVLVRRAEQARTAALETAGQRAAAAAMASLGEGQ